MLRTRLELRGNIFISQHLMVIGISPVVNWAKFTRKSRN
jgi:hypothetical protein